MTNTNLAVTIPPTQIRNAGNPVFPELRRILRPGPELAALIDDREQYGIAKYGQTLLTDDSRDTPTEIVNELLDALAYVTKWIMQEPNTRQLQDYHRDLRMLLADMVDYINMRRFP